MHVGLFKHYSFLMNVDFSASIILALDVGVSGHPRLLITIPTLSHSIIRYSLIFYLYWDLDVL